MRDGGLVAVPGADSGTVGAITLWHLSGDVESGKLRKAWVAAGEDPRLLPRLPTAGVALHRAMLDERGPRLLVRPLQGGKGWALVSEQAKGDDLEHRIDLRGKVVKGEVEIECSEEEEPIARRIHSAFERYTSFHSGGDIGSWLVDLAYRLRAVAIRETGGVYFVPKQNVERWSLWGRALEAASACTVYQIPAVGTKEAATCIMAAVSAEAEAEATRMEEELTELGKRGLRNRANHCDALRDKLKGYEDLLGGIQSQLHERLEHLQAAIAQALLVASDEGRESEDLF